MGRLDQYAKRTFAAEIAPITHGAVTWEDPGMGVLYPRHTQGEPHEEQRKSEESAERRIATRQEKHIQA